LCEKAERHYLERLKLEAESEGYGRGTYPYHVFRGERDYMPIFHSLGQSIGVLPSPLPRDLASWYTDFTVCLERAHELHELTHKGEVEWLQHANRLAAAQRSDFAELLGRAPALIDRLENL
jgi:hypothetical protein